MNTSHGGRFLLALLSGLLTFPLLAEEKKARIDIHGDLLPEGAIARLGSTRLRHDAALTFVAPLPDGKTVLSASGDCTVRVWDIASGKELRRFTHRENDEASLRGIRAVYSSTRITALQAGLSADGKLLATMVPGGRTIRLWDVTTGKEIRAINGEPRLWRLTLSPDGKTIAASLIFNTILLYDQQGREVRRIGGRERFNDGFVGGLRFLPGGKSILSSGIGDAGPATFVLRSWDVETGKEAYRLEGHSLWAPPAFSPDGKLVAIVRDNTILLVDATNGKEVRKFPALSPLSVVIFSRDGKTLVGNSKGAVRVWEVETGKVVKVIRDLGEWGPESGFVAAHSAAILDTSPDGKTLIKALGNVVRLIDVATGKELPGASGHVGWINHVRYTADGKGLLTGSFDGTIRLWDTAGKETGRVSVPRSARGFTLSPDGKLLWVQREERRSLLLDAATGKELRELDPPTDLGHGTFSPDGKLLALASRAELVARLYSVATGKLVVTLGTPAAPNLPIREVRSPVVAFSPDSTLAATAGPGNSFVIREVPSGELLYEVRLPAGIPGPGERAGQSSLHDLAFSPDGRSLAVDLCDNRALLYEVRSGVERQRYLRKGDEKTAPPYRPFDSSYLGYYGSTRLAFSPDGRRVALAGDGNLVHVWDTATGDEVGRLQGHKGNVSALAFSPDGRTLASGGEDSLGLIWDVSHLKPSKPLPTNRDEATLIRCWNDLGAADAGRAFTAVCELAAAERGPAFLGARLTPAEPAERSRLPRLIAALDAPGFATRRAAEAELQRLGGQATPALRKALEAKPSLEVRRRLEDLLKKAKGWSLSSAQLQVVRAIEALERAGTPAAKAVLENLAKGAPGALQTVEAKAALNRLR